MSKKRERRSGRGTKLNIRVGATPRASNRVFDVLLDVSNNSIRSVPFPPSETRPLGWVNTNIKSRLVPDHDPIVEVSDAV
jgi:hypothetical protein